MPDLLTALAHVSDSVVAADAISPALTVDESITAVPGRPIAAVFPTTTAEVAGLMQVAARFGVAVTARGSGTGLSGAAAPADGSLLICFERMNAIVELDQANHMAVVQPGVTLAQLDEALAPLGLQYPVFPGEHSASIGGNINTNAGGMRAVRYGVTRHHVVGTELVLADGTVLRTGGKVAKSSTGYDLTQLVIGSEGTLALVTEATLTLKPRPHASAALLAPFASLPEVTHAVPVLAGSGLQPTILEYIDQLTMAAMVNAGLNLGVDAAIVNATAAWLVVGLESGNDDRLDEDVAAAADLLAAHGAEDVFVLPEPAGRDLIARRESAFHLARANGADDVIDTVVPRAAIGSLLDAVGQLAADSASWVAGCGHAGDGNVHLAVFQPDPQIRSQLLRAIFERAQALGGVISGEHGIGTAKRDHFLAVEDPAKIELMRRIKAAFDPDGRLNPGVVI